MLSRLYEWYPKFKGFENVDVIDFNVRFVRPPKQLLKSGGTEADSTTSYRRDRIRHTQASLN